MILVDSSGWLEFFTEGPLADEYARRLSRTAAVVTPTIVVYEVYKRIKRDLGEDEARIAVAVMQKTRMIPLSGTVAVAAADLSLEHRLAMADAIILATARQFEATLYTSDEDFDGISGVTILSRKSPREG